MLATVLLSLSCLISAANTQITDLRVQNATEPLAIEDKHPVFSWKMQSDERGACQESYRIRVYRDSDSSMVWDSEEVNDGRSDNISYAGVALQPDMSYSWELTVKDNKGDLHTERSRFETGLMNPRISAWKGAKWIGGPKLKLDATSQSVFGIRSEFRILKGSYDSHYGGIVSSWNAENGKIGSYSCTVPANTSATLYLPVDTDSISHFEEIEGAEYKGVKTHLGTKTACYELTSGTWNFSIVNNTLKIQ